MSPTKPVHCTAKQNKASHELKAVSLSGNKMESSFDIVTYPSQIKLNLGFVLQ